MVFGRNIQKSLHGIEFAFQISCGFAFLSTFRLSNRTPNNANFDSVSSKRGNFDATQ